LKEIFIRLCVIGKFRVHLHGYLKSGKMDKIIGSWLMDVAKYVATAIIIGTAFKQTEESEWYYWVSFGVLFVMIVGGLILLKNHELKNNNNNLKS
jgi:hypothetical protein